MKIHSKSDYSDVLSFTTPIIYSIYLFFGTKYNSLALSFFVFGTVFLLISLWQIRTAEFLDETIIIKKPFFYKNKLIIISYSNLEKVMLVHLARGRPYIKLFYEYEGKKCKTKCYFKKKIRIDVLKYLNYKNVPIEFSKGVDKDDIRMIWKEIKQGPVL